MVISEYFFFGLFNHDMNCLAECFLFSVNYVFYLILWCDFQCCFYRMQVEVSKYTEGINEKELRPNGLPKSLIRYDGKHLYSPC